jgi:hypothetical protein
MLAGQICCCKPLVDKYPPLPLDKSCENRYHKSMVTGDTGHKTKKNDGNSMTLSSHPWRGPEAPAAAHPSAIARRQGSTVTAVRQRDRAIERQWDASEHFCETFIENFIENFTRLFPLLLAILLT